MSDGVGLINMVMLLSSDGFAGAARNFRLFGRLTPAEIASLSEAAKEAMRPLLACSVCYYWIKLEPTHIEAAFDRATGVARRTGGRVRRTWREGLRDIALCPRRDELIAWSLATALESEPTDGAVADALGADAWSSLQRELSTLRRAADGAWSAGYSAWDRALEAWMQAEGEHLRALLHGLHMHDVAGRAWQAWIASVGEASPSMAFWQALSVAGAARGFRSTTPERLRDVAEAAARAVEGR